MPHLEPPVQCIFCWVIWGLLFWYCFHQSQVTVPNPVDTSSGACNNAMLWCCHSSSRVVIFFSVAFLFGLCRNTLQLRMVLKIANIFECTFSYYNAHFHTIISCSGPCLAVLLLAPYLLSCFSHHISKVPVMSGELL